MKTFYTLLSGILLVVSLQAQTRYSPQDTLIKEYFEGVVDPSVNMLPYPSGSDTAWVNWDEDNALSICVDGPPAPSAWYLEGDFSTPNPDPTGNSCFTSCSYFSIPGMNSNWLITKRIYIPDSTYALHWRSLPYNGPAYMDGYLVLLSRGNNQPFEDAFQDTLFRAAETEQILVTDYSTKLSEYVFSTGYIHANAFSDTSYFFKQQISNDPPAFIYRGRLEPHRVSLSNFAGDSVFIAFLHQSTDDFILQIDDIVVASDQSSRVLDPSNLVRSFTISPNPVDQETYISWQVNGNPTEVLLRISSVDGREVFSRRFAAEGVPRYFADLGALSAGTYICSLQFPQGVVSKVLIKQ